MRGAKSAYEEAVAADAKRYSPDSFALASQALEDAMAEIQRQNAVFFRDFSRARSLLRQARQLARGARYEALARREEIRRDTATMLEKADRALERMEESISLPLSGPSNERTEWFRLLRQVSDTLAEARYAFHSGNYLDAYVRAESVVEQIRDITEAQPSS